VEKLKTKDSKKPNQIEELEKEIDEHISAELAKKRLAIDGGFKDKFEKVKNQTKQAKQKGE
jgi:hypothetical protein